MGNVRVIWLMTFVGLFVGASEPASAAVTGQLNIPCFLETGGSWKLCIDPQGLAQTSFDVVFPERTSYEPDQNFVSVAYEMIDPGYQVKTEDGLFTKEVRNVRLRSVTNAPPLDEEFLIVLLGVTGENLNENSYEEFDLDVNFLVTADGYSSAVLGNDPLAYWRLNETDDDEPVLWDRDGTEGVRARNIGRLAGQDALDGRYVGGILSAPGPEAPATVGGEPLVGFTDNTAFQVGAAEDGEYVEVSFEGRESPFNGLAKFTFSGWINPGSFDSNQVGLWGQHDALELRFIGPNAIEMWTQDGGSVTGEFELGVDVVDGQWLHIAAVGTGETIEIYANGNKVATGGDPTDNYGSSDSNFKIGGGDIFDETGNQFVGTIDEVAIWDVALSEEQIQAHFDAAFQAYDPPPSPPTFLRPGDANQDYEFDQFDLIQVLQRAKYLTGAPATWGDGDWDQAPGGTQGSPPSGDGVFDQDDVMAALRGSMPYDKGPYNKGPYAAVQAGGQRGDDQTSIVYDPGTGEVAVDAPAGSELTSINIDSAASIFRGDAADNLGGSFDNDTDNNIFKATFGSSFGSLSFGNVAQTGLSEEFLLADLTVVGSLAGGGDLGAVNLVYIPEPASILLLGLGLLGGCVVRPRSLSS